MIQIALSVLPADFARLGEEIASFESAGVDLVQWDVMDGHFVPNLTLGPDVIRSLRKTTRLPFEAQLMISDPERWAAQYVDAGCERVIVHAESTLHLHRAIQAIRTAGGRAGVAVNPATPLSAVAHVLDDVDLLLIMTVNPGFAGQAFIETMLPKIAEAQRLIEASELDVVIEVDGGVNERTGPLAAVAGARILVAATALFAPDRVAAIRGLREAAEAALFTSPRG